MMLRATCVLLLLAALLLPAAAVDRKKFRTCKDTGFCRRNRVDKPDTEVQVEAGSVSFDADAARLSARLIGEAPLQLTVDLLASGAARLRVVQESAAKPRWEGWKADVLVDSALAAASDGKRLLARDRNVPSAASQLLASKRGTCVSWAAGRSLLCLQSDVGVQLLFFVDGQLVQHAGASGQLLFEASRNRGGVVTEETEETADEREIVDWGEDGRPIYADGTHGSLPGSDEDGSKNAGDGAEDDDEKAKGMWEESWGGAKDSKPAGPTATGIDVAFPSALQLFGIPEHADTLALGDTDEEPYRLYNLDVFKYELHEKMSLYGAIPLLLAVAPQGRTSGFFWANPSETFVDISSPDGGKASRWLSESGVIDAFFLPGTTAGDVIAQFTQLTGAPALPPLWSLAYHQCRWNYKDEEDVANVHGKFEEHDFPFDTLWLDIEHTDGKRYFTWDKSNFPTPTAMVEAMEAKGRHMVLIVDPHIKRDSSYSIYKEATEQDYFIKDASGAEFDGWCWPGSSAYLDFTQPRVRAWWAQQFALDRYAGTSRSVHIWNDMNEPSVFNGPEVTMKKDSLSLDGVEHREWHNLYGFYHSWATRDGVAMRAEEERPFVLTRSFFAGSQRYAAVWTGDNTADWSHLAMSMPMIMSMGLAGYAFVGADVGGFFNNPDPELLVRWYQLGALQPFFRAHAEINTKRREPWLFGDDNLALIRSAVMRRYALLPQIYTIMYDAERTGMPPNRPLWMEFPNEVEQLVTVEDSFLLGADLLVTPVTKAGSTWVKATLPGKQAWYDAEDYTRYKAPQTVDVHAPMNKIPYFQRAGSVIFRKMRLRRSSTQMANDPVTLTIAADSDAAASGHIFLDSGDGYGYRNGRDFCVQTVTLSAGKLTNSRTDGPAAYTPTNAVDRIIILGLSAPPAAVTVDGRTLQTAWDSDKSVLVIRRPQLQLGDDWTIELA